MPRLVEAGWTLPEALVGERPPVATRIGVDGGEASGVVDARGAVSPAPGRPTLDWAVGADDRWYVPAREPGVEQVRVDHVPVVETRMRVPGGHVVQRAYGVRGPAFPGGDEWVVVEVENASSLPVALAWVVRPWDAAGLLLDVSDLLVHPQPGTGGSGPWHVDADGTWAVLPRRPSRWAGRETAEADLGTDPLAIVLAGEASSEWGATAEASSDAGLASLALLVPLPHTATATIALPIGADPARAEVVGWPEGRPDVEAVARGWSALVAEGPRAEVPDPVLSDAVEAARRSVLLAHRVEREPAPDDRQAPDATHRITMRGGWDERPDPVLDQMEVLTALARWGHDDAADRALITWPEGQQKGGGFGSVEATVAALEALAAHAVAAGDAGPARAWLPEVGGAVEWLGRRARKPAPDDDPRLAATGLDAAAVVLTLVGQPDAAAAVAADAARAAGVAPSPVPGAGPVAPTTTSAPRTDLDDPSVTPREVAAAAVAATRGGAAAPAVWALLRRASATWTWSDPERWAGDDLLVPARLLLAVGRLLVDDRPDGLALTTWMPPAWWGLGWEAHGVPTRWGRISYAVRWHSGRPALLWELGDPLLGIDGAPTLTAPGLDPTWSSTERRGEALLAAVAPPPEVDTGPEVAATGGVAVAAPPRSVWRPQDPGPDAPDGSFT